MSFKNHALACFIAIAVAGAWAPMTFAAGIQNVSPKASVANPDADMVKSLALVTELANYGYANKDPHSLILAAKIKKGIPTQAVLRSKQSEVEVSGDVAEKTRKEDRYTVDAMLSRAAEMSGQRPDILALINEVADMAQRGREGGPASTTDRVKANSVDTYMITYRKDRPARIYVTGDGDTDLDLYVYDENGNLICSDTDSTDRMMCEWTPAWTGKFRIRIRNLGDVYNEYVLITN